jgi:alpha 1,3-glucosidase
MWQDPFTLIIALSKEGTASGNLYLDDGEGYDYQKGDYILRQFDFSGRSLRSLSKTSQPVTGTSVTQYDPTGNAWAQAIAHVKVERIVVLGLKAAPKTVKGAGNVDLDFTFEKGLSSESKKGGMGSRLVIKNPGVNVIEDWEINLA